GWDVVEWCLAEGGAPVAHALRGALQTIPGRVPSDVGEPGWERYGLHGAALEAEEYANARADVSRKVEALA
ncbi:MAG: hypothetical protein LC689_22615, partial [Myxococcales bacterium]|nr:hypothetical protein [Myxococcales bacterium]